MQIAICIIMDRRLYKTSSRGISVRYHRESIYGIKMYFPFASASILYVTPCNVTEHGRGRSFEVFFYYVIFVGEIRSI